MTVRRNILSLSLSLFLSFSLALSRYFRFAKDTRIMKWLAEVFFEEFFDKSDVKFPLTGRTLREFWFHIFMKIFHHFMAV